MRLIIVSGRSGAGKSSVLSTLHNNGFYCIDNLPMFLVINLVKHAIANKKQTYYKLALSIDASNVDANFKQILDELYSLPIKCDVVYLDASDEILLRRFSQNGRNSALTNKNQNLPESLSLESKLLEPIYRSAQLFIDTSNFNVYQLYDFIKVNLLDNLAQNTNFLVESFGFKYGVPSYASMVFDVRCLPNPYWQTNLRHLSGLEPLVVEYFKNYAEVNNLIDDIYEYLYKWLPAFVKNNRSHVIIAIGCTGGFHRSVYCAQSLYTKLTVNLPNLQLRHRDLAKNSY